MTPLGRPSKFTREQKEILLWHLLMAEDVMGQAVGRLGVEHFNELERPFALMYSVASTYYLAHNKLPSPPILRAEISARLAAEPTFMTPDEVAYMEEVLEKYARYGKEGLDIKVAVDGYLQPFINERVLIPSAVRSLTNPDIPEMMRGINSMFSRTQLQTATAIDPFDRSADHVNRVSLPVEPTGCLAFDLLSGGGTRRTDMVGVLGPTGGGKTLLGIQIACSIAQRKEHVAYLTWEQNEVEIRDRMIMYVTGMPRELVEGRLPADMTPEENAFIEARLSPIRGYMNVFDMQDNIKQTGYNGMDDVRGAVRSLAQKGIYPRMVVIDWLFFMVSRYMSRHPQVAKNDPEGYSFANNFLRELKPLAGELNCAFMVLGQTNAEANATNSTSRVRSGSAAGTRSFGVAMDLVVTITGKDDVGEVCTLRADKARRAANTNIMTRLNGKLNRFEVLDRDEFTTVRGRDGTISHAKRTDMFAVEDPTARRSR